HEPERLFRKAVHGHRGHTLAFDPLPDARLKVNGVVPELRLAKGAIRPRRLDHGDLSGARLHAGLLQIVTGDAFARRLVADIDHNRFAHDDAFERDFTHRSTVGIEVPRRVDVCADVGV